MAAGILAEHNITSCPVIPETILSALPFALPVHVATLPEGAYGALYKDGNDFRIVLSDQCPTDGFRRFTLCHELGHFFLDGHLEALFEQSTTHISATSQFRGAPKEWFEREADVFASELLVPGALASPIVNQARSGIDVVMALASAFDSSLSCAAIRYAELTSDPVAVILSYRGEIEWVCFSRAMGEHTWARQRLRGEWAPKGSATAALSRSSSRLREGSTHTSDGWLNEWFDGAPGVNIDEEAVGLGTYGRVLTVISCFGLKSADSVREAQRRTENRAGDWRDAMRTYEWDRFEDLVDD